MQMGYGLLQEQIQKLIMTPELRQAITVLQFSAQELAEYLESEAAQNPVMELETTDWLQIAREQRNSRERKGLRQEKVYPIESVVRSTQSLEDYLLRQLNLLKATTIEKRLGSFIIGSLDSNGYLTLGTEEIADLQKCTPDQAERALQLIQSLEPTGIAARTLEECLLLQLREMNHIPNEAETIVAHHLQDVAQGKISKIASELGISTKQTQSAIDLIRSLDPKPGRWFSSASPEYIVPDVAVERVSSEYVVIINDRVMPRLHISDFYRNILEQKGDTVAKEAKDYIASKLNSALWLIKSIEQRRQTLYKVTEAIIDFQKEFLDQGIGKLRPMTLKQIAEKIGMHESTVSRAAAGKYVQTPRGVFELKYFFGSGVSTIEGDGAAAESIKAKIKSLIDEENAQQPLSDQKLSGILQAKGIQISRRTVAKYREEMGISSSMQRKRY